MSLAISAERAGRLSSVAAASKPPFRAVVGKWLSIAVLLVLLILSIISFLQINAGGLGIADAFENMQRFIKRVGAIEFPPLPKLISVTALTLGLVILGTVMAAILSVPIAYIAASNTTPGQGWRVLGRFLGVLARALPDVVLAMIFVLMFTIGTLPGILAIGFHSIGMISKMFADAIEQIDEGPVTAIKAAGGSKMQQFFSGVLPQVAPSWVATTLHRNDINLRGSVILGYVGIVGLGYEMSNSFAMLKYGQGLAYAIVIFALCVVMEIISSSIRRVMLGVKPIKRSWADRVVDRAMRGRHHDQSVSAGSAESSARAEAARVPVRRQGASSEVVAALRRPWTRARVRNTVWGWLAVAVMIASVLVCNIAWGDLITVWAKVPETFAKFWPLNFGSYGWPVISDALVETVAIALAATLISLVFSVVIGSLAARNVAPNGGVRNTFRFLLVLIRGIPETILAIMLIIISGLGAQAGTIALGICGIGLLGKLIADSFEEVDNGPERALAAAGGTRSQVYFSATLPQGVRALIAHTLYMLDTNIRSSTLLGIVGGGGVGYYLLNASQGANYGLVGSIVLMILVIVLVVEGLSIWMRRAFH